MSQNQAPSGIRDAVTGGSSFAPAAVTAIRSPPGATFSTGTSACAGGAFTSAREPEHANRTRRVSTSEPLPVAVAVAAALVAAAAAASVTGATAAVEVVVVVEAALALPALGLVDGLPLVLVFPLVAATSFVFAAPVFCRGRRGIETRPTAEAAAGPVTPRATTVGAERLGRRTRGAAIEASSAPTAAAAVSTATTAAAAPAAAATAAAAAPAAAVAAASATASAAAARPTTLFGFTHRNASALELLSVHRVARSHCLAVVGKGHEAEPARAARLPVLHHHRFDHLAEASERVPQTLVVHRPWKATDEHLG